MELVKTWIGNVSDAVGIERLGPFLTRRIFWRAQTDRQLVALSFDDGPHPVYTPQVLDGLHRYGVRATFFLIGQNVEEHPTLARRLATENHEIGNHTFTHPSLPFLSDSQVLSEIRRTHEAIHCHTGRQPQFLRPPMGLFSRRIVDLIETSGYRTVIGDVYPRDPHRPGTQKIISRILDRVRPGSLIILHDGGNGRKTDRSQTVNALAQVIPALLDRGFQFVTLSELAAAHAAGQRPEAEAAHTGGPGETFRQVNQSIAENRKDK